MLGFRGCVPGTVTNGIVMDSHWTCKAMKNVREVMGLTNVKLMIPFCRTLEEADKVLEVMRQHGLARGDHGLEIYVMAEIPSNIILADHFAERFDGFSIGSNDLTQLTLGIDRDSGLLVEAFDERNEAVKRMIRLLLRTAKEHGTPVGNLRPGSSDYPEFAEFLGARKELDSISLNPDSIIEVRKRVACVEEEPGRSAR